MILEFPARLQIEELEIKNYLLAMISLLASAFSHAESAPLTLAWNASEGAATYRVYSLYASDGQMHLIRYGIKETQVTITNCDTTGKRFVRVTVQPE
jgi:hypothetical protein